MWFCSLAPSAPPSCGPTQAGENIPEQAAAAGIPPIRAALAGVPSMSKRMAASLIGMGQFLFTPSGQRAATWTTGNVKDRPINFIDAGTTAIFRPATLDRHPASLPHRSVPLYRPHMCGPIPASYLATPCGGLSARFRAAIRAAAFYRSAARALRFQAPAREVRTVHARTTARSPGG